MFVQRPFVFDGEWYGRKRIAAQSRTMMKPLLYITILATAPSLWAQEVPAFTVNVNVVSLLATVRDHNGQTVSNLTPDDFVLKEDGVPRKIRYFSRESDLPLTVGLLVDTSRSQRDVLDRERAAAGPFSIRLCARGKTRHLSSTSTPGSMCCRV